MVVSVLLLISIIDLYRQKIPHWTLGLLLMAIFIEGSLTFHLISGILILGLSVALIAWADLGAGDAKLLLLLGVTSIPLDKFNQFLWTFSLTSGLLLSFHILRKRSLQGRIPLAPAIAGAFLLI